MDFKKVLFKTKEFDVEKALPDAVVFCVFSLYNSPGGDLEICGAT